MPLWIVDGKTLFFAHVPKTGGLSVGDYLARRLGAPMIGGITRVGTGFMVPPLHFSATDLKMLLPTRPDYCFAVVRDPVARLMSEFRFQARRSRVARLSFSTWLRIMLNGARIDPRIYENHLRPQSDLVPDGAEIFRFEHGFAPLIQWLDAVLGPTGDAIAMPHLNQGRERPIRLMAEDIAWAEAFYASDYQRFGLASADREGLPRDPWHRQREMQARLLAPWLVARERRRWTGLPIG